MANYFNSNYSTLFSSLNNSSSTNSSLFGGIDLNMYSNIKTGTYKKLLNAYYDKEQENKNAVSASGDEKTEAQQKVNATSIRDEAKNLSEIVSSFNDSDLWKKKEVNKEDGSSAKEYDTDKIYDKVQSFVKSYNSLVKTSGDSTNDSVLKSAANMVNFTKANKDVLSRVGITIGSDNKLAIDEETFKKSNMSEVKSVFSGVGSYANSISGNTSMMYGHAVSQLAKLNTTNMYDNSGAYSYISGSTYNGLL